jgi:D-alanyl-D-alanine carboxypeptidase
VKCVTTVLVGLLLPIGVTASDRDIPSTPAGQYLAEWLAASNQADRGSVDNFNRDYHRQTTQQEWMKQRQALGDLAVVRFEKNEPNSISVLLGSSESDDLYRKTVDVSSSDNHKILGSMMTPIDRPPDLAIPRMTQPQALADLESRINTLVAADKFSGAVLIESHGRVVYQQQRGMADRVARAPITSKTKFRLGSANKMFTALAILQLVEKGRVALDATVGQYVPDYPNREVATKVTIRQLLTHTGGTGEIFTDQYYKDRGSLKTLTDYVSYFGKRPLEFQPGTKVDYSNFGYIILGYIVERVSGLSYYEYVSRHIFEPSGMIDTASAPESDVVPHRAIGYTTKNGQWVPADDTFPYRGTSAGGGYSTVADLLRFSHALTAFKLLGKEMVEKATHPQITGEWYGYGFETHGVGPTHYFGHSGGAPGMNAEFRIYSESDTTVIILSNLDPPGASRLADRYALRMPGS